MNQLKWTKNDWQYTALAGFRTYCCTYVFGDWWAQYNEGLGWVDLENGTLERVQAACDRHYNQYLQNLGVGQL